MTSAPAVKSSTKTDSPYALLRKTVHRSMGGVTLPKDPDQQKKEQLYYAARSIATASAVAAHKDKYKGRTGAPKFSYQEFNAAFTKAFGTPAEMKCQIADLIEVGVRCSALVSVATNKEEAMIRINMDELNRLNMQRMINELKDQMSSSGAVGEIDALDENLDLDSVDDLDLEAEGDEIEVGEVEAELDLDETEV